MIQFREICLRCGAPHSSYHYTCPCGTEEENWSYAYRTIDLQCDYTPRDLGRIRRAIRRYRFSAEAGILQYPMLPHGRSWKNSLKKLLPPVGMTPLLKLRQFPPQSKGKVFIKDEGANPSGCFKDRETLTAMMHTLARKRRKAVIYSSGNAAASAALFAHKMGMSLITFVAGDTYPDKVAFIRDRGSDVVVIGNEGTSYESGFRHFANLLKEGIFEKAGYDDWSVVNPYRVQGDKTTAVEMVRQLRKAGHRSGVPNYVVVPTGNGSCLAGIWKGFRELYACGVVTRLPRMVSAGIQHASPVYQAVQDEETGRPVVQDLTALCEEDVRIGSTIVAEEGYDSIEATKAVLASEGLAIEITRQGLQKSVRQFMDCEPHLTRDFDVLPEPASYTALAAIPKLSVEANETVVAVITGHGMKAEPAFRQLIPKRTDLLKRIRRVVRRKKQQLPKGSPGQGRAVRVSTEQQAIRQGFEQLANK